MYSFLSILPVSDPTQQQDHVSCLFWPADTAHTGVSSDDLIG